jgi:hypothetical protein
MDLSNTLTPVRFSSEERCPLRLAKSRICLGPIVRAPPAHAQDLNKNSRKLFFLKLLKQNNFEYIRLCQFFQI